MSPSVFNVSTVYIFFHFWTLENLIESWILKEFILDWYYTFKIRWKIRNLVDYENFWGRILTTAEDYVVVKDDSFNVTRKGNGKTGMLRADYSPD